MERYISKFWDTSEIPHEAKIVTAVTSIRWIGWGFAESLIPILLFSFGHTFAEAGILRSAYDIAFIITLPIVGVFADRMRATTLVLIGLFLYLFVGLSYFLVGVTGAVIFIVLARGMNGVAYAFDAVGKNTCIRRHTDSSKLATVLGFVDTVTNFWWIMASLAGILLIRYCSITNLLLLIAPTSLISIIILTRYRKKKIERLGVVREQKTEFSLSFGGIRTWNVQLKSLLLFNLFVSFAGAVIGFFLANSGIFKW